MMHDASVGFAFLRGHVPGHRGRRHEHLASGGAHAAKRVVILGRRGAAACMLATKEGFVERRLLDAHVLPCHVQLLGDEHGQHGPDALADLGVFGHDCDDAVLRDADEGVDGCGFARSGAIEGRAGHARQRRLEREAAAHGEAGAQQGAAGQVYRIDGGFNGLGRHDHFASATCLIPARMRV